MFLGGGWGEGGVFQVKNDIMSVEDTGCSSSPLMKNTVDNVDQVKKLLLQTKETLLIKL
jgi:hypothetical protein